MSAENTSFSRFSSSRQRANISTLLHKSGVSWAIREFLLQRPPHNSPERGNKTSAPKAETFGADWRAGDKPWFPWRTQGPEFCIPSRQGICIPPCRPINPPALGPLCMAAKKEYILSTRGWRLQDIRFEMLPTQNVLGRPFCLSNCSR